MSALLACACSHQQLGLCPCCHCSARRIRSESAKQYYASLLAQFPTKAGMILPQGYPLKRISGYQGHHLWGPRSSWHGEGCQMLPDTPMRSLDSQSDAQAVVQTQSRVPLNQAFGNPNWQLIGDRKVWGGFPLLLPPANIPLTHCRGTWSCRGQGLCVSAPAAARTLPALASTRLWL